MLEGHPMYVSWLLLREEFVKMNANKDYHLIINGKVITSRWLYSKEQFDKGQGEWHDINREIMSDYMLYGSKYDSPFIVLGNYTYQAEFELWKDDIIHSLTLQWYSKTLDVENSISSIVGDITKSICFYKYCRSSHISDF